MATRERYGEPEPLLPAPRNRLRRFIGGGVEGNHRLTATTGLVLLILLAVEGFTVLSVRGMFTIHAFVGILLIPPIGLKLVSTGYRFLRYYTGGRAYRLAGPPQPLLRLLAPLLVFLTAGLFGTGVALLLLGPSQDHPWRQLHSVFFFFWFWVMSVHVLAYVWRVPRLARADVSSLAGGRGALPAALTREALVVASLVLGVVIAVAALPWDSAWTHWFTQFRPEG